MQPEVLDGNLSERSHPHDTGMRTFPWSIIQWVERGPYNASFHDQQISLQSGETWIIPPQVPHRIYAPKRGVVIPIAWIHFRCRLEDGSDLFDHYQFPRTLNAKAASGIKTALHELLYWRTRRHELIPHEVRYQKRLYLLVERLLQHGTARHLNTEQDQNIQHCLSHIKQHLEQRWDRAGMAALAHLSISRFHDVFKSATGQAPALWIRQQRIDLAKDLLAHSDKSIVRIAAECGFDDPYHFSRVFKQMENTNPSNWRQQIGKL